MGRCWRRLAAAVAATAIAATVFLLRRAGILDGIAAIVFAILLVLLLPFSNLLSRRILVAGALFLGWMPVLWWLPLPVPEVDRVGIVLSLLSGGLVGWVLWGAGLRIRARRLLPQVAAIDAMPVAAAGLTIWMARPLIVSPSGERSLNVLVNMGWDHVSHLAMAFTARTHGAIAPFLGNAPDGSHWVWSDYPQHFHAAITALTELHSGPVVNDVVTEVLRYGRSLGLAQVIIVGLLAAGVAQLPNLRRRPLLAWPCGALVSAAFLLGPGSWALSKGFPNFVWTCAVIGLIVLLATSTDGRVRALDVFALGGLVVATVHGWVLLAPIAVVGCVVALLPCRRDRWTLTRVGLAKVGMAFVATVAASAAVIPVLRGSGALEALGITNDLLDPGPMKLPLMKLPYILPAGGIALATGLAAFVRKQSSGASERGIALAAVPGIGFALLGAMSIYLHATGGDVSYYFDKLLVGAGLVSVVVIVTAAELHVGPPVSQGGWVRRIAATLASLLAVAGVLFIFGTDGLRDRNQAGELKRQRVPAVERILDSVAVSESRPFGSTVYLAAVPEDPFPLLAYYWNRALTGMWTHGAGVDAEFPREVKTAEQAAEWVSAVLGADQERFVIVAPEIATGVRSLLPDGYAQRVLSW